MKNEKHAASSDFSLESGTPLILGALAIAPVIAFEMKNPPKKVWFLPALLASAGLILKYQDLFAEKVQPISYNIPANPYNYTGDCVRFRIPPQHFHPNFQFHTSKGYGDRFCAKHFPDLPIVYIDAYRFEASKPRDLVFDYGHFAKSLPVCTSATLLVVTMPSSTDPKDAQVVTVFISPETKRIRVNDPLCNNRKTNGDVITFPFAFRKILEQKYSGYSVINEHKQLQYFGESNSVFLAHKMAQYYTQGKIEKLTRAQLLLDWPEDMALLQPRHNTNADVKTVLTALFRHIDLKLFNVNSAPILANLVAEFVEESEIEKLLQKLTSVFVYLDDSCSVNELNADGVALVESFVTILQKRGLH
nr:hypothetical protein [Pseudomonadota bacterium]